MSGIRNFTPARRLKGHFLSFFPVCALTFLMLLRIDGLTTISETDYKKIRRTPHRFNLCCRGFGMGSIKRQNPLCLQ